MPPDERGSTRQHALVVERDMIVGLGLAEDLTDLGYRVSGPFLTVQDVVALLSGDPPDFAIVDVGLRDGTGRAAAEALQTSGIRLVIFSAGDRRSYRDGPLKDVPWVEKPATVERLLEVLGVGGTGEDSGAVTRR